MEKQRLFQYAVILHEFENVDQPTSKKYKGSKLIIEPKYVMAKTEKDVVFKVTREIPEEFADEPDNVEILVRNF